MPTPLLATKFYLPPRRADAIRRARLGARLDAGLDGRLILVAAGAGFGKTTLLAEWAAGLPDARVAWLSLDEGDGDPAVFLAYLVAALRSAAPELGEAAQAALDAPQPPPAEAVLTLLLNDAAALPPSARVILVLDDYHLVDAPAVDACLRFLIDRLPPQLKVVIATREDPPLPLARLRARGQLTELRAADLCFTREETAAFLVGALGLELGAAEVAALAGRTEGWIAGLQLAGLALRGQSGREFVEAFSGSHRFVLDYLLEEVLGQQDAGTQAFLLRTAILDRLCGPLCDAVCGGADGQATLEGLERANLFLAPLDGERRWWRYHRLFRDLLAARLAASGEDVRALHRRASAWCDAAGLADEAFGHALAAGETEGAAGIAERAWPATFRSYLQNAVFLRWMRALPEDAIRRRPVLCAGYGWALVDFGEVEAAAGWLADAEGWLDAGEPAGMIVEDAAVLRGLAGSVAVAQAYVAMARGDAAGAEGHAARALARLPEEDAWGRAGAVALLGAARLHRGDLAAAEQAFREGLALARPFGMPALEVSGIAALAATLLPQGRLDEAARLYEAALAGLDAVGGTAQGTGDALVGLAGLALDRGDRAAAAGYLRRCDGLGEGAGLPGWLYHLNVARARLAEAAGDADGALVWFDAAGPLFFPGPMPDLRPAGAWRARLLTRLGRWEEALAWAAEGGLSLDDEPGFAREFELVTLARAAIAAGERARGEGLLARLLAAAEAGGRWGSVIDIREALELARGSPPGARRVSGLVEPLTARELEILRLIAAGLSNGEIAARLFLAVNTVKGHNRVLFGKLGVARRTEAVARGRELGVV